MSANLLDLWKTRPCKKLSSDTTNPGPDFSGLCGIRTMSAMAEVLHPFIEETWRATAGSHSLPGETMLVTAYLICFFQPSVNIFYLVYVSNNQCVPASLSI